MALVNRKRGHREKAALWDLRLVILPLVNLTIGHTRGKMLSVVVPAPAEITGALSRRLRWLSLQHTDNVHTVNALQSRVQALHCSRQRMIGIRKPKVKMGGEGNRKW